MMRGIAILLFSCATMLGCKEEEVPPLPREKMTAIVTDLHLAEVYSSMVDDSTHKTTNKNLDSLAYYYKSILAHHSVSMQEFSNSLKWYSRETAQLDSVYVNVLAEISIQEGSMGIASPE
jgi:hypothetical protein